MMRKILSFVLAAAALCCCKPSSDSNVQILIGTLTGDNGSEGVYLMDFNLDDASYTLLDTEMVGNPTFMVPGENGMLYVASEYSDGTETAVSCFLGDSSMEIQSAKSVDGEVSGGNPCNIIVVDGNVITSNYTGGTMSALHINADGSLSDLFAMYVPEGEGESHMHCATLSPDGKYLFTNDLGKDALYRFTTGDSTDPFKDACTAYQFDRELHPGPRHMIFSQDGRFAYLLHELGDMLTIFSYDDGVLEHLSTQMAYDGEGHGSADLHFSPDGMFLYTSHRLKEDGISVFSINKETGEATRVGFCKTGTHPRNFAVSPDGQYILCACRDSQKVEIYKINSETGMLENTGKFIPVPEPMFVMFN